VLFNSLDYFVFLPLVLVAYFVLPLRGRQIMLVLASLFFYACWRWPYVGLLLLSAVVDYSVARAIEASPTQAGKKRWVTLSVVFNLAVLGFFKYWGLFVESLGVIDGGALGLPTFDLLLPMGISFYTFQTMAYTIDVYRGKLKAEKDFVKVLLYVCFFPQLVAGPIERATHLLPQLSEKQAFAWNNITIGSRRILIGMVKKVLIADNVATVVNTVYTSPGDYSAFALVLATWGFAIQIFCDFSGYSDIAIGTARLMGIDIMENFKNPYRSRSIQEFWRRWHISLSSWLRDYLYIPLGGNRFGPVRTYINLFLTMVLGGLWHGASFNFVIWGMLHGSWLAVERFVTRRTGWVKTADAWTLRSMVQTFLVFQGVCLTWVFFRANTLGDAMTVLWRIATLADGGRPNTFITVFALGCVLLGGGILAVAPRAEQSSWRWWLAGGVGVQAIVLFGATSSEFIYFVF
jgi:D-alanyl-lipoteichoic acid acyltransferase DltB (MBOAT superfamily)